MGFAKLSLVEIAARYILPPSGDSRDFLQNLRKQSSPGKFPGNYF